MATIIQPNINPTNKLTASVVAVAVIELLRVLVQNFWPGFDDAALWPALAPIVVFAIGYFIKDEANVVLAAPLAQEDSVKSEIKTVSYQDF